MPTSATPSIKFMSEISSVCPKKTWSVYKDAIQKHAVGVLRDTAKNWGFKLLGIAVNAKNPKELMVGFYDLENSDKAPYLQARQERVIKIAEVLFNGDGKIDNLYWMDVAFTKDKVPFYFVRLSIK